jgi:hypothetical protein
MRPPSCHVLIERTGTNHRAAASRDEIRLFARCRNEILRLPAFFQHYRAMGVDRFYIVDNESYGRAPLTECPGFLILLHFKLLHDLHAKARDEAARGEYSRGALEYRRYARALDQNPRTTFMYEGSVRFESTSQLVRLGLMQDSEAWMATRGEVSA